MGAGMCDAPEGEPRPFPQRAAIRLVAAPQWGAAGARGRWGKNLANARQQDFVEDVVGCKSAQIVVAGSDDRHHFKVGKDNEPLTSVAHGADIARPPRSLGALIW